MRSLVQAEFPSGISVLRNYDPSVPDLVGDIEQLIQAVLNVVRNAAQALLSGANGGRGGTIILRTRSAAPGHDCPAAPQAGIGIASDWTTGLACPRKSATASSIRSFRGREGGSGIGLALVQTYVQNHGGVVEFDSRPGRTVFTLLLPLA